MKNVDSLILSFYAALYQLRCSIWNQYD